MTTYDDLPLDVIRLTMLELPYHDIISMCQTEQKVRMVCQDEKFWRAKIVHDFKEEALGDPYLLPELSNRGIYIFLLASRDRMYVPGAENFIAGDVCLRAIFKEAISPADEDYFNQSTLEYLVYFIRVLTRDKYLYPYEYKKYLPYYGIYNCLSESIYRHRDDLFSLIWNNIIGIDDFIESIGENNLTKLYNYALLNEEDVIANLLSDHITGNSRGKLATSDEGYPWPYIRKSLDKIDWDNDFARGKVEELDFEGVIRELEEIEDQLAEAIVENNQADIESNRQELRGFYYDGLWGALIIGNRQFIRFFISKLQPDEVFYLLSKISSNVTASQINALYLNMTAFTLPYLVIDDFILPQWDELPIIVANNDYRINGFLVNLIPPREKTYVSDLEYIQVVNNNTTI